MPSRIQSAVRGCGGSGSDSGPAYRTAINHLPATGPWTGNRRGTSFILASAANKDGSARAEEGEAIGQVEEEVTQWIVGYMGGVKHLKCAGRVTCVTSNEQSLCNSFC